MKHPLDIALERTLPVVAMPRYGDFEPLRENGQRLLIGSNGLFLEVRRAWVYAITEGGELEAGLSTPFGRVEPVFDLTCGTMPRELMDEFVAFARSQLPNEAAGCIVLDTRSGTFELRLHRASVSSSAHIEYRAQALAEHEALVVDVHSHGRLAAGFSALDDLDDRGSTKIAVVVGRLDRPAEEGVELAVRLCLNGVIGQVLSGHWSSQGAFVCQT